jgi:hypothetical protein
MDDLRAAGARSPDTRVIPPAIRVTAPLVPSDEGDEGGQHIRHGGEETIAGHV